MKRRSFLQMLGAGVTAPFMPAAPAVAAKATYSSAAVHAAIYHAQSRAVFSVWGLAKAANLSLDQATAVMEHLAERGILGPLQGTTFGGRWASSRVLLRQTAVRAQIAKTAAKTVTSSDPANRLRTLNVDLSRLLAHLRKLSGAGEPQHTSGLATA